MSNKANKIIIGGVSYNIEDTETKNKVEELNNIVEEKVDKEDYCPKLTSGFANNLSGRGEAIETQITFRPTGGTKSIEDGVAHIECVKGNTIVWNQNIVSFLGSASSNWYTSSEFVSSTETTKSSDGRSIEVVFKKDSSTTSTMAVLDKSVPNIYSSSHKYLVQFDYCMLDSTEGKTPATTSYITGVEIYGTTESTIKINAASKNSWTNYSRIISFDPSAGFKLIRLQNAYEGLRLGVKNVQLFNLTLMFGAGKEPTIDEFRRLFPDTYYEYNKGQLISSNPNSIRTVGFNQFDKTKAQYGVINGRTVSYDYNNHFNKFYVSDYIRVVPSEKYYFKNIVGRYYWTAVQALDANKQYIGWYMPPQANSSVMKDSFIADFSDRPQVCYIRICLPADFLDSCCVNLVHTGYRNGDYEPYEETTRLLPVKDYFPDGMKSARSTFDELTVTQAIKRVGIIEDLSKLDWIYFNSTFVTNSKLPGAPDETNQIVSALKYSTIYDGDKCYTIVDGGKLYVRDSSYTDANSFKNSLAGVKLCYALKDAVVTDLPEPINLDYKVSDFGTEEALFDGNSAPLKADIVYGFNAVDTIRSNRLSIEDLLARVAALENKL